MRLKVQSPRSEVRGPRFSVSLCLCVFVPGRWLKVEGSRFKVQGPRGKGLYSGRWVQDERGFSLIEAVMVIIVLAISVPVLVVLLGSGALYSIEAEQRTQATLLAQEKMDEIIADKNGEFMGRGYAYVDSVIAAGGYNEVPLPGYTCTVTAIDTSYGGVTYKEVTVRVSTTRISDVVLRTWLTEY